MTIKLIISFITTIANYDYGFYYELHQDGMIKIDVKEGQKLKNHLK